MEKKYPIRYVARAIIHDGKVVAYFVSLAHLFEERKKYKADGTCEQKCEIDFVTQIHDEEFEVENSPAMKRYYKEKVFTRFEECERYAEECMYNLRKNLYEELSNEERKEKVKEFRKYSKFLAKMNSGTKFEYLNILREMNKNQNNY